MEARLFCDLLGDCVVQVANGGLRSKLGALRTYVVKDEEAAYAFIRELNKRRVRHHYWMVAGLSAMG